jgi:hypothetical protein
MSYTISIKDGRKIVKGVYLPYGYTCLCKQCNFSIEVLSDTPDSVIAQLVKLIEG